MIALLAFLSLLLVTPDLSKEEVKKLVAAGISDDVIVEYIRREGPVQQLTPQDLIDLRHANVSDKVLAAMMESTRAPAPEPSQAQGSGSTYTYSDSSYYPYPWYYPSAYFSFGYSSGPYVYPYYYRYPYYYPNYGYPNHHYYHYPYYNHPYYAYPYHYSYPYRYATPYPYSVQNYRNHSVPQPSHPAAPHPSNTYRGHR